MTFSDGIFHRMMEETGRFIWINCFEPVKAGNLATELFPPSDDLFGTAEEG